MGKNLKIGLGILAVGIVGKIAFKEEKTITLREQSSSMKGLSNLLILIGGGVTIYNIVKK